MNELIKVTYEDDKGLVNARELHEFLEVKQDFTDWVKKQLDGVDAVENVDFTRFPFKREGNNATLMEYIVTLEIAKEINMVAGVAPRCNEQTKIKSKEARKYFIQCERKLKEVINKSTLPTDYISALKALVESEEQKALMQPKVQYYESVLVPNTYVKMVTATQIGKDLGMTAQGLNKKLNELGIYYKPKYKNKLDINKIIKKYLETLATKENNKRAKEILLIRLGYEIYEDVPKDILNCTNTYNMIFDICKIISNEGGEIQTSLL